MHKPRILLTRPKCYSAPLALALQKEGLDVAECPMMEYLPPADWQHFESTIKQVQPDDWCFFVSQKAIEVTVPLLQLHQKNWANLQCVCMGKSSEQALQHFNIQRILRTSDAIGSSETLLALLKEADFGKQQCKAYYFCGDFGREVIPQQLQAWQIPFVKVISYRTRCPEQAPVRLAQALAKPVDAILVTSEQILNALYEIAQRNELELSTILHIVISSRLKELARQKGATKVAVASSAKAWDICNILNHH